jgi:CAAX protease family protein
MNQTAQTHSAWTSIALHLIPGALLTAVYYVIAPAFMMAGYPAMLPLLVCILVILIPIELGILFYQGRKLNGRWSLQGVVLNRERIPLWQYFVFVPLLLAWGAAVFLLFTRVDYFFIRSFFGWLPRWSMQAISVASAAAYPPGALLLTTGAAFLLNGVLGPVTEELYFRGYLLPRIPASRVWAPLINALLFSLYHFFSPWQNVTRIVALIPLVYAVAWKRNLYISLITHVLLNILGMISLLALAFR